MPIGRVPLRVLGLFGRGRDGVKADVREKDDGRRRHHAREAVRHERRPVLGFHVGGAGGDEEQDGGQLDGDHHRVEARALAHADDEQPRDEQHDDRGRQVDDRAFGRPRGRRHPDRQVQAEAGEDALEVPAPADGHRHRPDRVLENEVPADHPREDLAERGVRVGIGAARDGDHRGELRVAQRRKRAREAGGQVRHADGRARLVGGGRAGEHEDARADDGADAQQRQVEGRQRALERLAAVLDVADQLLE